MGCQRLVFLICILRDDDNNNNIVIILSILAIAYKLPALSIFIAFYYTTAALISNKCALPKEL